MIRTDRFRISDRPYAVDLNSLNPKYVHLPQPLALDAVWFRRRKGTTVAVAGVLSDFQPDPPVSAEEFLARNDDGRYGGHAKARWDGNNLWAPEMAKDEQDRYYELLLPMLEAFPAIPSGFDGWWTFKGAV